MITLQCPQKLTGNAPFTTGIDIYFTISTLIMPMNPYRRFLTHAIGANRRKNRSGLHILLYRI